MAIYNTARTALRKLAGRVTLWLALNIILLLILIGFEFSPLSKPSWWEDGYSVATNVLAGGLVSFFFYWLVVYLPEHRKRHIIKQNLSKMYHSIKKEILIQVIFASIKGGRHDLHADEDTIANLMTTHGFKEAFSGGHEANEGFYAFENQIDHDTLEFREIILNLELLAKQIEFVLHNYTMEDENIFDFFKSLELLLLALRRSSPGYEESKPLSRFLYQIFSGWDWVEGYHDFDPIEKMIADI